MNRITTQEQLVERLHAAAGERKLREVSRRSAVPYPTLRKILKGQRPRIDTFEKLARCDWPKLKAA